MLIKPPPHDIELEKSMLATCFVNPGDVFDYLLPDHFYRTDHQAIYSAMLDVLRSGGIVDMPSVVQALKKADKPFSATYIAGMLEDFFLSENPGMLAKKIIELSSLRALIMTCYEIISSAYGTSFPTTEILDTAQSNINKISISTGDISDFGIKSSCLTIQDEIDNKIKNPGLISGIRSGYDKVDYLLHGFQPSDVILLAARPSMGKTALMLNMAVNISEKSPCAVISLEMSKKQLLYRVISQKTGIKSDSLMGGRINIAESERISETMSKIYGIELYIDDQAALTVNDIRQRLRKLKKEKGIKVAFIDYLQLIKSDKKPTRDREVAEISSGLKQTAKELDIPIIVLSQLNRELEKRENKRPILSDLRDSGTLEQDADVVLFLYRPAPYIAKKYDENNLETPEYVKAKNEAELNIAKHRNGQTGCVRLYWKPEITTFFNQVVNK